MRSFHALIRITSLSLLTTLTLSQTAFGSSCHELDRAQIDFARAFTEEEVKLEVSSRPARESILKQINSGHLNDREVATAKALQWGLMGAGLSVSAVGMGRNIVKALGTLKQFRALNAASSTKIPLGHLKVGIGIGAAATTVWTLMALYCFQEAAGILVSGTLTLPDLIQEKPALMGEPALLGLKLEGDRQEFDDLKEAEYLRLRSKGEQMLCRLYRSHPAKMKLAEGGFLKGVSEYYANRLAGINYIAANHQHLIREQVRAEDRQKFAPADGTVLRAPLQLKR